MITSTRCSIPVARAGTFRNTPLFGLVFLIFIVLFAESAYAQTRVTLKIVNPVASNGQITVTDGTEIEIRFKVNSDPQKILGKKDRIQLVRVSDNGVVASARRGKKKSGTVTLTVADSAGEQLYVRYIAKQGDALVAQTSHPSMAGYIPLVSAATQAAGGSQAATQTAQVQAGAQTGARAAGGNPANIKAFDILGVGLGVGLDEAHGLLTSTFPDYLVVPINYDSFGARWTGILAAMPEAKHKSEVVLVDFALPPLEQRAIAVTRYKEFPSGATPSLENLEKSLIKKYGQWSKADDTTRGGYRKIYYWRGENSPPTCMNEKLHASWGRMKQIVEEGSLSRVLGDAYGDPSQYITGFRDYAEYSEQTPVCGKQVTVEISYRPDQPLSPVNVLIAVIADFPAYFDSETEFSKMAGAYRQQQAEQAVQKGGEPEL